MYAPSSAIAEVFGVPLPDVPELDRKYNLAPTDPVLGVRISHGARVVETFRWGLVPFWADDPKIGARMINARSETAPRARAFRDAFARRRMVVVANGFYEWRVEDGRKQPWFYRRTDDRPVAFAGLWERWHRGDRVIRSCTILTTDANDLVRPVHDRMPVILPYERIDAWLDPDVEDPAMVRGLLVPYARDDLGAYRVSMAVNSVKNDGPDLVAPVE